MSGSAAGTARSALSCETCRPEIREYTPGEGGHTDFCLEQTWSTSPPNNGYHFSVHAEFKTYADSVPYGYLVHSMEHGGVVIGYHCPEGCPEEVAMVQAAIDRQPEDPANPLCGHITCHPQPKRRYILAPDPRLDVRWAASAWGSTWKSDCPDTASLMAYARGHYRQGPEDLLGEDGVDYSGWGWCPWPPPDTAAAALEAAPKIAPAAAGAAPAP